MIIKTYQSVHFIELDTYVSVRGIKTLIQFRSGSLKPRINGKYSTSDPEVIKALDNAGGNGKTFTCINVENIGEPEVEKTAKAPKTEATPKAEEKAPEGDDVPSGENTGPVVVLEVTNLQEAKEFLLGAVDGLKVSNMPNAKSIENQAKKNNYSFPNLKQ